MIPDSIFFQPASQKNKNYPAQHSLPIEMPAKLPLWEQNLPLRGSLIFILGPPPPSIAPFFPACLAARLQLLKRYLPNLISRRPPQLPCTFPHTHTGSTAPSPDLASHVPRKKWPGVPGTGWDPAVRTLFTDQPSAISTLRNLHMTQICRQRCMCKIFLILIPKFAAALEIALECKYPEMANIIVQMYNVHTSNGKMSTAAYIDKT